MKRISVAGAILSGLLASSALAQTAIQPGTIVGTFDAQGYSTGAILYTVPAGKTARITDVHATNFGDVNCFFILNAGGLLRWTHVAPRSTFVLAFNTGLGLTAGQVVSSTGCPDDIYLHMRGFYFTIP